MSHTEKPDVMDMPTSTGRLRTTLFVRNALLCHSWAPYCTGTIRRYGYSPQEKIAVQVSSDSYSTEAQTLRVLVEIQQAGMQSL